MGARPRPWVAIGATRVGGLAGSGAVLSGSLPLAPGLGPAPVPGSRAAGPWQPAHTRSNRVSSDTNPGSERSEATTGAPITGGGIVIKSSWPRRPPEGQESPLHEFAEHLALDAYKLLHAAHGEIEHLLVPLAREWEPLRRALNLHQ